MPKGPTSKTQQILDMFNSGMSYKEIADTRPHDPNWSYINVKDIIKVHRRQGDPRAQRYIRPSREARRLAEEREKNPQGYFIFGKAGLPND